MNAAARSPRGARIPASTVLAAYNMTSRALEALEIPSHDAR